MQGLTKSISKTKVNQLYEKNINSTYNNNKCNNNDDINKKMIRIIVIIIIIQYIKNIL